jgi:hypothetical protein
LSDESPPPKKIKLVANMPYQKGEVSHSNTYGIFLLLTSRCVKYVNEVMMHQKFCFATRATKASLDLPFIDRLLTKAGFHIYCLNPPLSFVPTNEEWYCGPCLFAQGDGYGFDEGEDHSIASFQARDAAFAKHWFTKHPMDSAPSGTSRKFGASTVSEDDVEREFWRLTQDSSETVEIEYGADVHSTTHGR